MAKYLADLGIKVTLSTDALLPELMSKADLLLLGADSVGRNRFINKIGTGLLLREARRLKMASAVFFESLKIKEITKNHFLKDDYNKKEIWPGRSNKNVTVINQYRVYA